MFNTKKILPAILLLCIWYFLSTKGKILDIFKIRKLVDLKNFVLKNPVDLVLIGILLFTIIKLYRENNTLEPFSNGEFPDLSQEPDVKDSINDFNIKSTSTLMQLKDNLLSDINTEIKNTKIKKQMEEALEISVQNISTKVSNYIALNAIRQGKRKGLNRIELKDLLNRISDINKELMNRIIKKFANEIRTGNENYITTEGVIKEANSVEYINQSIKDTLENQENEISTQINSAITQIKSNIPDNSLKLFNIISPSATPRTKELHKMFEPASKLLKEAGFPSDSYGSINEMKDDLVSVIGPIEEFERTVGPRKIDLLYGNIAINKKLLEDSQQTDSDKYLKLKSIEDKFNNIGKILDQVQNSNRDMKINNKSIQQFFIELMVSNDVEEQLRSVAPELFLTNSELEQKEAELENRLLRNSMATGTGTEESVDKGTGDMDPDFRVPRGYFKLGVVQRLSETLTKEYYLTITDAAREGVNNSYRVVLSEDMGDNEKKQLLYGDSLGRIKFVQNNYCLDVQVASQNASLPQASDIIVATRCIRKPTQRFFYNSSGGRVKLVNSVDNSQTKELYLTHNLPINEKLVKLQELDASDQNQSWFLNFVPTEQNKIKVDIRETSDQRDATKVLEIPNTEIKAYSNYTYSLWVQISENAYKFGKGRYVLVKGNAHDSPVLNKTLYQAPSILVNPDAQSASVEIRMSTNYSNSEARLSKGRIKVGRWNHIGLIILDKTVNLYINGNLDSVHDLNARPNNNDYSLFLTPGGGVLGKINKLRYYNYARSNIEIIDDMRQTAPESALMGNIQIEHITSNRDKDDAYSGPETARLHNTYGWIPKVSSFETDEALRDNVYLQYDFAAENEISDLNRYYQVNKILVQGHGVNDAYVKQLSIKYFDYYDNTWKDYERKKIFDANTNNLDVVLIDVNFHAKAVQIYPQDWNRNNLGKSKIGLRVGFQGVSKKPNKCDKMISVCDVEDIEKRKNKEYAELQKELDETEDKQFTHEHDHNELKSRIKEIEKQLNDSRIELMLSKNAKCEPQEKCVPDVNCTLAQQPYLQAEIQAAENKCRPGMFPIDSHPDFYKFIKVDQLVDPKEIQEAPILEEDKIDKLCTHLMKIAPGRYSSFKECKKIVSNRIRRSKLVKLRNKLRQSVTKEATK